uniref:Uncharacterized protein n=1 Tax=Schizaphis graminum TaxID=13262 RepID=A0A2S2PEZ4_SCHGA
MKMVQCRSQSPVWWVCVTPALLRDDTNYWCACTQERDVTRKGGMSTLMREDDVVKPASVAGGSIKGLRVFREIGSLPDDEEPHWTIHCLWRHTKWITRFAPYCHNNV